LEDVSILAVRRWSESAGIALLVGLSLGRGLSGASWAEGIRVRLSELSPGRRMRESRANLVVVNKTLAAYGVLRWAKRHDVPTLVWTVDAPDELRKFLRDPRVWMVTTNYPSRALALRSGVRSA
jgi:glycerophosphoryl diester phosphodiesterase